MLQQPKQGQSVQSPLGLIELSDDNFLSQIEELQEQIQQFNSQGFLNNIVPGYSSPRPSAVSGQNGSLGQPVSKPKQQPNEQDAKLAEQCQELK